MHAASTISDMHIFSLERQGGRLQILRRDQHLLRRFGQLDLFELAAGQMTAFILRAEADEIWALLEGRVTVVLADRRPQSPSSALELRIDLDAAQPQGILIPFGVAHAFHANTSARLLRLATHVDGSHREDEPFSIAEPIAPSG